jgi:hypothetical protein
MDKKQEQEAVYILIEKYRASKNPVDYLTLIDDYNRICKELVDKTKYENNSNSKNI